MELGERLAEIVRRKLSEFPAVEVVNAPFESWEPNEAGFDAVTAFTAFHWVDPEVRYAKSTQLLRSRGSLAVVATKHVLPEDGYPFFRDVQEVRARLPRAHPAPDPGAVRKTYLAILNVARVR